jgi:xylulokinase
VLWFQNTQPTVHAQTCAYLEPMDYLVARLSGRIAATANTTIPYALTDTRNLTSVNWSDELVARAGVDRSRLPEIVETPSVVAPLLDDVRNYLGLRDGVVVAAGCNDNCSAALGTGAVAPGRGTVVMGTTAVFAAHHGSERLPASQVLTTMPSALNDRYFVVGEAGLGGKVLETAVEQWFVAEDAADARSADLRYERFLAAAAGSAPGAAGVQFLPWINGSFSPAYSHTARGGFVGLSLESTRSHIARAVLEGISMQMRWLVDEIEVASSISYESVRFAGGGAQSDVWASVLADVLGRAVEPVESPRHANCRGAAFLGLLAIGALRIDDIDSLVPVTGRFEPGSNPQLFSQRLEVHRDLHRTFSELGRARTRSSS